LFSFVVGVGRSTRARLVCKLGLVDRELGFCLQKVRLRDDCATQTCQAWRLCAQSHNSN
jgi:hypothetical protein